MSKVTYMTKEELLSSLDEHIKEVVFRYKKVWESYENLGDHYRRVKSRYNELKEMYEDLKQEESEPQYDYEAYNEGFAKGEQSMQEKANKILEYYQGINDATVLNELFGDLTYVQIFGDIENVYNKIINYEKKKKQEEKEIHVGDEVVDKDGEKYIVRKLDDGHIYLLGNSGDAFMSGYENATKTGKHYPIDDILKELE